jgi:uncharacterized protein (TIGR02569 family)
MGAVAVSPPDELLAAFAVDHRDLAPLRGGQGKAWGTAALVFKPLDMSIEALEWQEGVLGGIQQDGFRVARPVRAADGRLAVAGWSVWQRAGGEHRPRRWAQICAAGERFHRATAGIPVPGWHLRCRDSSARADRAAWEDGAVDEFTCLPPVARLAGHLRPVHGPRQLIHGDLSGNVLFHPHLPPAIIDLSPYWRPPSFASAVVAVDALVWEGASRGVLSVLDGHPDPAQHLLRAAIFRIVMDHLFNPQRSSAPPWWPSLLRVVDELCDLAESAHRGV